MKLKIGTKEYERIEIENFWGDTLMDIDLKDWELADIENHWDTGEPVVRIQPKYEPKRKEV